MNRIIKVLLLLSISSSVLWLNACNSETEPLTGNPVIEVDVEVGEIDAADIEEALTEEAMPDLALRASPQLNLISLDWDTIPGAVDYTVTRELQEANSSPIQAFTGGDSAYSFTTIGMQTYSVWVAALDVNGNVLQLSNIILVTSADPFANYSSDVAQ